MKIAELKQIPVSELAPSFYNSRKINRKDLEYKDLLNSVRASGILIPLAVSKNGNGYSILAGERRFNVAQELELETVPCVVHEVDEAEASQVTFVENAFRQDLSVFEESQMVTTLLGTHKDDAKAVAGVLGQTEKWVLTRSLIDKGLIKQFKNAYYGKKVEDCDPDDFHVIQSYTAAHFSEIAKLPESLQTELFGVCTGSTWNIPQTAKDIATWVSNEEVSLKDAPFDIDKVLVFDKGLDGIVNFNGKCTNALGTCRECKQRTGYNPTLWGDSKDSPVDDKCLNPDCFALKLAHASYWRILGDITEKERKKYYIVQDRNNVPTEHFTELFKMGVTKSWDIQKCKKADTNAMWVYFTSGKKGHYANKGEKKPTKAEKAAAVDGNPTLSDGQKKKKRMGQVISKRQIHVNHAVCERIIKSLSGHIISDDIVAKVINLSAEYTSPALAYNHASKVNSKAKLGSLDIVWQRTAAQIYTSVYWTGTQKDWSKKFWTETKEWAILLGIDIAPLAGDAVTEIPTPKSCR